MKKRTIAIADDHNLFRKGLISLLKKYKDIDIVCEAPNGKALLDCIRHNQPEVVLLNIQMPVMDGLETLAFIRKKYPAMKVLVLSGRKEEKLVCHLMEKGANGFLCKDVDMKILVNAIHEVAEKGYYLNDHTSMAMANGMLINKKVAGNPASSSLSHRELDVVKLICKQKTIKEIADTLCLSPRTIDTYRENIFQKTGAKNVVGIVIYAIQHNILDITALTSHS